MEHRTTLGRTGLRVSPICYGTWQLSPRFWGKQDEQEMIQAMRRAYELGINFYDTADAYGDGLAEQVLGRALGDLPREKLVIASKVYWHFYPGDQPPRHPNLHPERIAQACEESLRRMNMDYMDLYQIHAWDALAPMDGMIEALENLKKQGKIRHYGVSNWTPEQMRLGHDLGGDFATCQPVYSLIQRRIEADVLPYCQARNMGVLVYSPLHKGLLSGKYQGHETFDDLRKGAADFTGDRFTEICRRVSEVGELAREHGMTTVEMVLAVTLAHPGITCPIVGIKNVGQIEQAASVMGKQVDYVTAQRVRALLSV